jgi:hypothetical protein
MSWLRSLFAGRHRSRPASQPSTSPPRLEGLEERVVPNASVAFTSKGAMVETVVYDNGSLVQFDNTGARVLATSGIRVAHAFRDLKGNVGMDVVYQSGLAFEYDSNGGTFIGSNILDLSRAYAANGDFRLEVLYSDSGTFGNQATGNLVEFSPTAVRMVGSKVYFATAYVDAHGQFGLAQGTIDASSNALAAAADSFGSRLLYNGSSVITQALGDYDQTTDPSGQAFINLVFNPANSGTGSLGSPHTALQINSQGVLDLGINVAPL